MGGSYGILDVVEQSMSLNEVFIKPILAMCSSSYELILGFFYSTIFRLQEETSRHALQSKVNYMYNSHQ
jgi:hypothetical protein